MSTAAPTTDRPDTDTTVVVDVDLSLVPTCEMGEDCVGEHGPAVARLLFQHVCDHPEHVLVCLPCTRNTIMHMPLPVELVCPTCQRAHFCLLLAHCQIVKL